MVRVTDSYALTVTKNHIDRARNDGLSKRLPRRLRRLAMTGCRWFSSSLEPTGLVLARNKERVGPAVPVGRSAADGVCTGSLRAFTISHVLRSRGRWMVRVTDSYALSVTKNHIDRARNDGLSKRLPRRSPA